jgi:hypothetical protein
LIAYEFALVYDPTVIRLADVLMETPGTLSGGWSVHSMHSSQIRGEIRIIAFSTVEPEVEGIIESTVYESGVTSGSPQLKFMSFQLNER